MRERSTHAGPAQRALDEALTAQFAVAWAGGGGASARLVAKGPRLLVRG